MNSQPPSPPGAPALFQSEVVFARLEDNVRQLQQRLPEMPMPAVLLSRLFLHLGRGMAALLDHEIRPCGLAEPEFRVLTSLFAQQDGAAHPSDLCARTSHSPANMSRISDSLVERGLITRVSSERDRRKMVLRITAAGEELVRRLLPSLFAPLHTMFSGIAAEDQQRLIAQLTQLGSRLEKALSDPGPAAIP